MSVDYVTPPPQPVTREMFIAFLEVLKVKGLLSDADLAPFLDAPKPDPEQSVGA
jgi:hypothetical protein